MIIDNNIGPHEGGDIKRIKKLAYKQLYSHLIRLERENSFELVCQAEDYLKILLVIDNLDDDELFNK